MSNLVCHDLRYLFGDHRILCLLHLGCSLVNGLCNLLRGKESSDHYIENPRNGDKDDAFRNHDEKGMIFQQN